jgi:SHS2 domain-containing protein
MLQSGHDLSSLLYQFLDEFLFRFSTDYLVCKDVKITLFDREKFTITAIGYVHMCQSIQSATRSLSAMLQHGVATPSANGLCMI